MWRYSCRIWSKWPWSMRCSLLRYGYSTVDPFRSTAVGELSQSYIHYFSLLIECFYLAQRGSAKPSRRMESQLRVPVQDERKCIDWCAGSLPAAHLDSQGNEGWSQLLQARLHRFKSCRICRLRGNIPAIPARGLRLASSSR